MSRLSTMRIFLSKIPKSRRAQSFLAAGLCAIAAAAVGTVLGSGRAVHAASTTPLARTGEHLNYCSPLELLYSPDGARIYVLCNQSDEVRVLDASTFAVLKNIPVGHIPRGFSLSPDGHRLFVANSWDDTLSVIDTGALEVVDTWPVRGEPSSVVEDRAGKRLYVAGRVSNDVAVLDAQTGAELKRLAAGRGASYIAASPDNSRLYVTHIYPDSGAYPRQPESEITVINTASAEVVDRIPLKSIAGVFHTAVSADGRLSVTAELHPKNLVTLTQVEHGAIFEDTLTLFGADVGNRTVEVPLDELERYAARPFAVAITPSMSRLYVTSGGSEVVLAIDLPRLLHYIRTHRAPFYWDLSASANYVVRRIAVGHDPRGLALSSDGRRLLVANRLDDTISVIDTRTDRLTRTFHLPGPTEVSVLRHGEQTFYTARYSFHGGIGCASCHIDSTFDGLQWDLEPNGLGRNIVDNRLLEDIKNTAPYKWNGGNPNLPTECGPRTEKYFWRAENYDDLTLADLVTYIRSLPARPNRWHLPGYELTPAQERGEAIFNRAVDNFGQPIPLRNRCSFCHSGPLGTDNKSFDVGTKDAVDDSGLFDTPQLTNIALTAPYLHDGSAPTLEEIWTIHNPDNRHGQTSDLTKDELNDLVEYLRSR